MCSQKAGYFKPHLSDIMLSKTKNIAGAHFACIKKHEKKRKNDYDNAGQLKKALTARFFLTKLLMAPCKAKKLNSLKGKILCLLSLRF